MDEESRSQESNVQNLGYLEGLLAAYLENPDGLPPRWQHYFAELVRRDPQAGAAVLGPSSDPPGLFNPPSRTCRGGSCAVWVIAALQERVDRLVHAYRVRGHLVARCDPLGLPQDTPPELDPKFHGLKEEDLDRSFAKESVAGAGGTLTLRRILELLRETYCRSIGVEFMHIDDPIIRTWLQTRMESSQNRLELTRAEQLRILTELTDAVIFEEFIQKKYVGAKRFSLEGAESLIPLLDLALEKAGRQGLDEVVMGMAHRGRLNVLANVIGKGAKEIFREFEDADPERYRGGGDVKYHLGYTSRRATDDGRRLHLSLCFNPSHLEFVNPVALGRMRAKQGRVGDDQGDRGMVLLIHGDAAFAGQGVVQETFNLSGLPGYSTGGTLHVVVNNQIGFTTAPEEGRSDRYCTSVARMLRVPIFHVNGEDPEAVAQVVRLAMDFRKTFRRDVVIDMYCYRRYGHNESDEPAFTQPTLYEAIRRRKSVRQGYLDHLLKLGGVSREEADRIARERREHLENELAVARSSKYVHRVDTQGADWEGLHGGPEGAVPEVETALPVERCAALLAGTARLPDDFRPHPRLARFLAARQRMAAGEQPLDWSAAEALAFASLATAGHPIRLSGQDSGRGTFSHRHAILYDHQDGRPYIPLRHLAEDQAPVEVWNSPPLRGGGARFRIRLFPGGPRRPGGVGGPVRRFHQRRPGDRRPVHRQRRGEVGPPQRSGPVAAPRVRGSGAGAFERPPRAVPHPGRQGQHPGGPAHHAGPVLPSPPAAGDSILA